MSQVTPRGENRPAVLPFPALGEALAALSVSFTRRGEDLALKNGAALTAELRAAVADHKAGLLTLCDLRAGAGRLFDYGIRLRCADPPRGTRAQALLYQSQQIEKLAALTESAGLMVAGEDGQAAGYADPSDPWAEEVLLLLRVDLGELSRQDAPYPLGVLTADPFSMDPPRLYSGRLAPARHSDSTRGAV